MAGSWMRALSANDSAAHLSCASRRAARRGSDTAPLRPAPRRAPDPQRRARSSWRAGSRARVLATAPRERSAQQRQQCALTQILQQPHGHLEQRLVVVVVVDRLDDPHQPAAFAHLPRRLLAVLDQPARGRQAGLTPRRGQDGTHAARHVSAESSTAGLSVCARRASTSADTAPLSTKAMAAARSATMPDISASAVCARAHVSGAPLRAERAP